ncbi:anti-FecI sigma factor FecR [Alcanivorax xiamenensis]|uniref:Anti-FecI sigma factor FecR n=1 Tax=Alcanivorax xiamenensis TaxID=1177156 RepID=A0ABQ6Y3K6_9GAMM|nr:FecR domain-containing protein [Alcanivorax xiamenensis]KAF0803481.1 anti-FecI sigma factor FecR [Alcanivorax xiamenensis]
MTSTDNNTDSGMIAETARHWVIRTASGSMDQSEQERLHRWLAADLRHRRAFEREQQFWEDLAALEADMRPAPKVTALPVRRRRFLSLAAAASVALVMMVLALRPQGDFHTAPGEIRTVALEDGSRMILDTDSAVDVHYDAGRRRIELRHGRAWFEVVPNKQRPFQVWSQGGMAQAVGTAYQVEDRGRSALVTVTHGAVLVRSPEQGSGHGVTVHAGQAVAYDQGQAPSASSNADVTAALLWTRGRLELDDLPLDEVVAVIQRYHPGKVLLLDADAGRRRVSAMLSVAELDKGLDALAESQGLTLRRLTPYLTLLY